MLTYIEKEFKRARKEGHEEGREEGREEGLRAVVIRMLASGMAISLVSEMTGLSPERIKELSQEE